MINKVAVFRKDHGYSQEFLAKKLGVSRQTIISIEKGKYNPSLPLALLMAEIFEAEVKHIFSLEESDRP